MFLQTKLYASYVRYWHFAQYVAHLVDITCMWVDVDVGKGDAGGCQASAHRPRLRFDIWKTLQDFSPAVFVVTKPGHVGRKPLFLSKLNHNINECKRFNVSAVCREVLCQHLFRWLGCWCSKTQRQMSRSENPPLISLILYYSEDDLLPLDRHWDVCNGL